jgi:hypothetical protein
MSVFVVAFEPTLHSFYTILTVTCCCMRWRAPIRVNSRGRATHTRAAGGYIGEGGQQEMADSLRDHVNTCDYPACVATRKLENNGPRLTLGKGRHCELAVLAAAGPGGMTDGEIVAARRAYAEHLGVSLDGLTTGEIANAPFAIHARHAAEGNVKGVEDAQWPINLGTAGDKDPQPGRRIVRPLRAALVNRYRHARKGLVDSGVSAQVKTPAGC